MDDPRPGASATARRYAARIRARGPMEVSSQLAAAIGSWRTSRGRLLFLSRAGEPGETRSPGLTMRRATPEDGERYAQDVGTDSAVTFRQRLNPSMDCYLVLDGERIVHASWVSTEGAWVGELRRYFVVPSKSAYVYESFTSPHARGRGIYPGMLRYIASVAARDGSNELWIGVGDDNAPSIRAISKAGFVPAFEVDFSRRLGRVRIEAIRGPRSAETAQILRASWPSKPMDG